MKITRILSKNNILAMMLLAFFSFFFLGTEYLFDNCMAIVIESSKVVNAQNIVLGFSVIGFILYGLFVDKIKNHTRIIIGVFITLICVLCEYIIVSHMSYGWIMGAGIICFVFMGIIGSASIYVASRMVTSYEHMAKIVGLSYALGILLQFINNNLIKSEMIEASAIGVFLIIQIILLIRSKSQIKENIPEVIAGKVSVKSDVAIIWLTISVVLMTVIFSTLDNAVTLVHASGAFDVGQWPRLLLGISGICAGFLFDIKQRNLMPITMYGVTILSVLSIIIIGFGGNFVLGLIIFYVCAGFFVVYFTTAFMDVSFYSKRPKIWAGIGRGINNLTSIAITSFSVMLLTYKNQMLIMSIALILFVLVTISIVMYYWQFYITEREEMKSAVRDELQKQSIQKNKEMKFQAFIRQFSFTTREQEVMKEFLQNADNVSEISKKLGMARATLYRHISSMSEKVGVNSRKELLHFYHNWENE